MISSAVAVALDGFAWVQGVPPDLGHELVADLGSPAGGGRRLRELTARPGVHGCIGKAYSVDNRTVVASARAVERLILAAAGPAVLDGAPACLAGLSMDPWADPLSEPRVQRLVGQDRAWAAAARASGPPSVAIVVPFRGQTQQNRAQQLERFAAQFPDWFATLRPAPRRWHVVVVEQTEDGFKFNRGKLLNIGFDLVSKDRGPDGGGFGSSGPAAETTRPEGGARKDAFDIVVMHDVDLIPTHPGFADLYLRPRPGPVPIAKVWEKYRYPNYIGGITGFSAPLFRKINGYPNNFWGWGGEDDDLRRRLEAVGHPPSTWEQPPAALNGRIRDLEEELIAERGGQRASVKLKEGGSAETLNMVRTERLKETYRSWWRNGLSSLNYRVLGYRSLGPRVTVVTVDLLAAADKDSVRLTDLPEWARAKVPKRARR
ncbi:hypothetical protein FNF27_02824 [Cafeteria roenbergensis]|uniref:Beta-1,4-galactosyltransferase 3 n=1 Tax=Cafeteria roenbergensis TaxID=33653 RepID=A0A5A8EEN9_CAFRO|nr:hypothetical protein FNF27_02824 [Cafeteria roenbergensis]